MKTRQEIVAYIQGYLNSNGQKIKEDVIYALTKIIEYALENARTSEEILAYIRGFEKGSGFSLSCDVDEVLKYVFKFATSSDWKEETVISKPLDRTLTESSAKSSMTFSEAQEYCSIRGIDIPWNDGDIYIDRRNMTQTVANVLKWADEHPIFKPLTWKRVPADRLKNTSGYAEVMFIDEDGKCDMDTLALRVGNEYIYIKDLLMS